MQIAARGLSEHSNTDSVLMGCIRVCGAGRLVGRLTTVAHMQEDERGSTIGYIG